MALSAKDEWNDGAESPTLLGTASAFRISHSMALLFNNRDSLRTSDVSKGVRSKVQLRSIRFKRLDSEQLQTLVFWWFRMEPRQMTTRVLPIGVRLAHYGASQWVRHYVPS